MVFLMRLPTGSNEIRTCLVLVFDPEDAVAAD